MNKKNRRNIIIPILSIVIVLFAVVIKYSLNEDNKKILTTSALMEVVDVADLSTAKFTYNGIADVYKDSEKKKLKYHVLYYSEVKVGVNMKDINFEIDETQKKVIAKLPEVQIQNIDVDENIKFLPENKGWDIKEAYKACELDVNTEANESDELFNTARKSLKSMVEVLTSPLINQYEYELVWD